VSARRREIAACLRTSPRDRTQSDCAVADGAHTKITKNTKITKTQMVCVVMFEPL